MWRRQAYKIHPVMTAVSPVKITRDGKAYAFTYNPPLSDLFVVEGVR